MQAYKKAATTALTHEQSDNSILPQFEAAYIRLGYAIFPLVAGQKVPMTSNGFWDAVHDLKAYEALHRNKPRNVGWPTGEFNKFWVLDVDPKNGGDVSYLRLIGEHGPLPQTWSASTPSGGKHVYFKWNEKRPVGSRANVVPGIDTRGNGGYVVIPPSQLPNGGYEWLASPSKVPLADAPEWLYELVMKSDAPGKKDHTHLAHGVASGSRNVSLTELTGVLLGRGFNIELAWSLLDAYNQVYVTPSLSERELLVIFESIAERELQKREARVRRWV